MGKIEIRQEARADGYINMLTKYGTSKDATEAYTYEPEIATPDVELAQIYSSNGLFAKIINHPAEMAFKMGFDLGLADKDIEKNVETQLAKLKWKHSGSISMKWARLFGGAAILMIIDDGGDLDDPVDENRINSIDRLVVLERPEIRPDYASMYTYTPDNLSFDKIDQPEYYLVTPTFGGAQIRVHESRLLIFRNGNVPKTGMMNMDYKFFGIPEYNRWKRELKDTVTVHGNGYRLLERCVQAVYKMKNLAAKMSTIKGEDEVVKRMQLIDMARNLLNTMVIDADGEDYAFQNFQLGGVKDIIDESCNLLSAVTNIPQTILFGRSPAGENSTGESDLTNYYDYIGQLQSPNIVDNLTRLVNVILLAERNNGRIADVPEFDVIPNPIWNLSEKEQAEQDQAKAAAELTKAQATQLYVDMQALDPREVRKSLAENDQYQIEEILSEDDLDMESMLTGIDEPEGPNTSAMEQFSTLATYNDNASSREMGSAVIIVKNGKILCGTRKDSGLICGPGGHIETGESAVEAVIRETEEEFAIKPQNLKNLGYIEAVDGCLPSAVFLCADIDGTPLCYNDEMENAKWLSMEELSGENLFPAFEESLNLLVGVLTGGER